MRSFVLGECAAACAAIGTLTAIYALTCTPYSVLLWIAQ